LKTRPTALFACLALGLGVTIAGCGGDDDDDSGSAAPKAQPTETQAEKPAPPKKKKKQANNQQGGGKSVPASMKDIAYHPDKITVTTGESITWTNKDQVEHDVTKVSGPGPTFKSGPSGGIEPGQSYRHKFTAPGTIVYQCTVHPGMEGTVVVK